MKSLRNVFFLLCFIAVIGLLPDQAQAEMKKIDYIEDGIEKSKIKIESLSFELKGQTYEIALVCNVTVEAGYSLFNPPGGAIISICDFKGLKPGVNRVTFKIDKSKYESLTDSNDLTLKFLSCVDESDYGYLFFKLASNSQLPKYDENSNNNWQVDLRGRDISSLDICDRMNDLLNADFDSFTRWPKKMPEKFDPVRIMETAKSPGLKMKELYKNGITGKGISIALIDQKLLKNHIEYKDRIKHYEEIHCLSRNIEMHGAAVVSLAAGKTVGVAPEADIYYIAETHGYMQSPEKFEFDFVPLAQSIDKIIQINSKLPSGKKIRVISISVGWSSNQKGYAEVSQALARAKKEGIFVVSSVLEETYGMKFYGLGRPPLSDPDEFSSYTPGKFWQKRFYKNPSMLGEDTLLVPMDSRTYADYKSAESYSFNSEGGFSWSIPYIAGMYALCCQVKPDITPEIFWKRALETGDVITLKNGDKQIKFGKILNPVKLIEKIKN